VRAEAEEDVDEFDAAVAASQVNSIAASTIAASDARGQSAAIASQSRVDPFAASTREASDARRQTSAAAAVRAVAAAEEEYVDPFAQFGAMAQEASEVGPYG